MDVDHNTRPRKAVAPPTSSDVTQITAQQLGCLQVIVEQLFQKLRADLASPSEPLRSVERTLSEVEQQYQDCLEVYGAARESSSCARSVRPEVTVIRPGMKLRGWRAAPEGGRIFQEFTFEGAGRSVTLLMDDEVMHTEGIAVRPRGWAVDVDGSPSDLPENMQTIPAGSTVRRMKFEPNSGEPYRAVTVDVPDGTTVELWVDPQVAPVLAAQLADAPVYLSAGMGDYQPFADGELTGLQEAGLECARCGRYVEDTAVATRLVGYTSDLNSTVVACHPRCGSSPWDVEQLRWLLDMPDVEPGAEEPRPTTPLTCDGCGFDAPALYVDDPSGQRWCGTCKATVRDVLPPQMTGATPVPPRLDDVADPAGGAS